MLRYNARTGRRSVAAMQLMVLAALACPAGAGVQEYFDDDREQWFSDAVAVGSITTIGFNDLGNNILVTEQYADLGVHFTFIGNFTRGEDFEGYPQDGWGLDGNTMIRLEFDNLQSGIAFDFPGPAEVDLFLEGELVHDSSRFGGSGAGRFGGVFNVEFDEAIIVDWTGTDVFLDDLHFVSIPAPPALALLLGVHLIHSSRRRTVSR